MTERVMERETESGGWGQADGVFTSLFSCLSWKKAHELCLVFILWNYIRLNTSNRDVTVMLRWQYSLLICSQVGFFPNLVFGCVVSRNKEDNPRTRRENLL